MTKNTKLRVRMLSGKIYGPYSVEEVLSFIDIGKISGEEEIFFEGETKWRLVGSEPIFFDKLQDQLINEESLEEEVEKTAVEQSKSEVEASHARFTSSMEGVSSESAPDELKLKLKKSNLVEKPETIKSEDKEFVVDLDEGGFSSDSGLPVEEVQGIAPVVSKATKKQKNIFIVLVLFVVCVVLYGALSKKNSDETVKTNEPQDIIFNKKTEYQNILWLYSKNLKLPPLSIPKEISIVESWKVIPGMGAHRWIQDLNALSALGVRSQSFSSYWGRYAWNALWLSLTFEVSDKIVAERFWDRYKKIAEHLKSENLLTLKQQEMFVVLEQLKDGDLLPSTEFFLKSTDENFKWVGEELYSLKIWEEGGYPEPEVFNQVKGHKYSSKIISTQASLRDKLAERSNYIPQFVEKSMSQDPESFWSWFALAKYFWHLQRNGYQKSQSSFLVGLNVLSLYPRFYQKVFWKNYHEFYTLFGHAQTADIIKSNLALISRSDFALSSELERWRELSDEGFSLDVESKKFSKRISKSFLSNIDIAFLEVIGKSLLNKNGSLTQVAEFYIFEQNKEKAETILDMLSSFDPKNPKVLGMKAWNESQYHNFNTAYAYASELSYVKSDFPYLAKYNGIVDFYRKDYLLAIDQLQTFVEKKANDGLSHYFLASSYLATGKNYDCTKSANLGTRYGEGVVRFASQMLFFKCRIKARLGVEQVLREFKTLIAQNPDNVLLQVEYIQSLLSLKRSLEAQAYAEKIAEKNQYSYEMKIALGDVYAALQRYDEALLFYNNAKVLDSYNVVSFGRIAALNAKNGKYKEAAYQYKTAGLIDSNYPDIFLLSAQMFRKAGMDEEAFEMYRKEIEVRPQDTGTFLEFSKFLLESNAPQEVPELFQLYKDSWNDDPRALLRLSQAYVALGEDEKAMRTAQLALINHKDYAEPYKILAVIFEKRGKIFLAKENYEKYLRFNPAARDSEQIRVKLSRHPFVN